MDENGNSHNWWLRSPDKDDPAAAAYVSDGVITTLSVESPFCIRPACNIYLKSVLFTSAAQGGKISGTPGADALTAVSGNSSNEWKLTLKDNGRSNFTASAAAKATLEKGEGYSGWSVPVVYSNAKTGDNEYVSVILCDSNDAVKYYGNIANNSAASSESGQYVTIPAGLAKGSYKMHVFNEQINGDKCTDYASEFSTIYLKVKDSSHASDKTKKIVPKGTKIKKLKKAKRAIKVKWKKQKAKISQKHISGYQIQLATNKKFTKNKKTVTVKGYKKTTKKVKKLKGKTKYYVHIRTYMKSGGNTYYSPWSKTRTVKTK